MRALPAYDLLGTLACASAPATGPSKSGESSGASESRESSTSENGSEEVYVWSFEPDITEAVRVADMQDLIDWGVRGIITNNPSALEAVLNAAGMP